MSQSFFDNMSLSYKEDFLKSINNSDFRHAKKIIEKSLKLIKNFNKEYEFLKCIDFWIIRFDDCDLIPKGIHRAKVLTKSWREFENFLVQGQYHDLYEFIPYFKKGIYNIINDNYLYYHSNSKVEDRDVLFDIAHNCLILEEYERSQETFLYLYKYDRFNSKIISYLADTYYLLNDKKKALFLFQEAFIYDPFMIDLNSLKSSFIFEIIKEMRLVGFWGKEINLWFFIYGIILGFFDKNIFYNEEKIAYINSKRYKYEQIFKKQSYPSEELPILINYYLFLINSIYGKIQLNEQDKEKIKKNFSNIKKLDEKIGNKLEEVYRV